MGLLRSFSELAFAALHFFVRRGKQPSGEIVERLELGGVLHMLPRGGVRVGGGVPREASIVSIFRVAICLRVRIGFTLHCFRFMVVFLLKSRVAIWVRHLGVLDRSKAAVLFARDVIKRN